MYSLNVLEIVLLIYISCSSTSSIPASSQNYLLCASSKCKKSQVNIKTPTEKWALNMKCPCSKLNTYNGYNYLYFVTKNTQCSSVITFKINHILVTFETYAHKIAIEIQTFMSYMN